jgi:hypothetical protein
MLAVFIFVFGGQSYAQRLDERLFDESCATVIQSLDRSLYSESEQFFVIGYLSGLSAMAITLEDRAGLPERTALPPIREFCTTYPSVKLGDLRLYLPLAQ